MATDLDTYMGKPSSAWYEKARVYGILAAKFKSMLTPEQQRADYEASRLELDAFDRRVLFDVEPPSLHLGPAVCKADDALLGHVRVNP